MVVLDASVVLKWFHGKGEHDREKALDYMRRHYRNDLVIHAPDLLLYEVTNALIHKPGIGVETACKALDSLKTIMLSVHWPGPEGMKIAAGIADDYAISVYDASYVALARELGAPLVTADKKLAGKLGNASNIFLLSEIQT